MKEGVAVHPFQEGKKWSVVKVSVRRERKYILSLFRMVVGEDNQKV